MQFISVLGSTGSIGQQTLDVVAHHPEHFRILAIAALNEVELLCEQVHRFNPAYVVVYDESKYQQLKERIPALKERLLGLDFITCICHIY